ncbi:prepilin peptidase [Marinomonas sp. 2405UD68-3]|uniref:prepilin peptidase n=1 Tax=Marinomonas sp. 2405UD68-3 TaxID=3391835 RepID=UPI0039C94386
MGSLISAFLHRWPIWCEFHWRKEAHSILEQTFSEKEPPSFTSGRSQCTHCNKPLSALELIPIFSFVFLLGKCKHCKTSIGIQYLILELATLIICLPLLLLNLSIFETLFIGLIFCCLLTISVFDFHHQWIPDELNGLLILFSLLLSLESESLLASSVYGMLLGYGGIYVIRFTFLKLRNIEIIGLGDAKLLAGIGAWFGVSAISYILFLASTLGLLAFLFHKNRKIAFGPYLCLSAYIFFWNQFI